MHQHTTNKLAKRILKQIAQENGFTYKKIKTRFTQGDTELTYQFWEQLRELKPNHPYRFIYHCPACGQFDLE